MWESTHHLKTNRAGGVPVSVSCDKATQRPAGSPRLSPARAGWRAGWGGFASSCRGEEKPCRPVTEVCSRVCSRRWMAAPRGWQEGKEPEGDLAFPICYSTWDCLLILGYRVCPHILLGSVFQLGLHFLCFLPTGL